MKLGQSDALALADSDGRSLLMDRDGIAHGTANRYQGWQRAMEQAELAGWFKEASDDTKGRSDNNGQPDSRRPHEAPARNPASEARLTSRDRVAVSSRRAAPPPGATEVAAQADPIPQEIAGASTRSTASAGQVPAVGSQSSAGARPVADVRPVAIANTAGPRTQHVAALWQAAPTAAPPLAQWNALIAQFRQAVLGSDRGAPDGAITAMERTDPPALKPVSSEPMVRPHANSDVLSEVIDETEDDPETPLPSLSKEATSAAPSNPPVRIHVEWTEQGARVWLGVDGDDSAALPEIRQQLERMLSESGHRLLSLVCNGRTVTEGTPGSWDKRVSLAKLHEGQYRQVLQSGDWSADQPMFHIYEQGAR